MGWWDEGIMGGDTPLDIRGVIEDIIGGEATRTRLNRHLPAVLAARDNKKKWWGQRDDRPIFTQVIGFLIITTGANLPEELRQEVLDVVDQEIAVCEADGDECTWVNPEIRVERLKEFRQKVVEYQNGKAVEVHERGLLAKMSDMLDGKNT